jgi:hypothetical protein
MCARLNAPELQRRLLPRSGGQGVAGSNPAVPPQRTGPLITVKVEVSGHIHICAVHS